MKLEVEFTNADLLELFTNKVIEVQAFGYGAHRMPNVDMTRANDGAQRAPQGA